MGIMLIIDGYNLIHAIGLLPNAPRTTRWAAGKLQQARETLLGLLKKDLSEANRRNTVVVFDALEPPDFLPDSFYDSGIHIVFSRDYNDADELIIEMIQSFPKEQNVVVISSDHRIQAYARRRKFPFYDSDQWYFGGMPLPKEDKKNASEPDKPDLANVLSEKDVSFWINYFNSK